MRSYVRGHLAALGYLVLVLALLGGVARVELLARDGAEAHDALCAMRADLERRAYDLAAFIEAGRRIPGVTQADLVRSLQGQRRTIESLEILDCPQD